MLYFIPAWYKQNMWCENEQQWYKRRLKSEFDETIKQITLFHRNVDRPYRILALGYSPNFRHFLHRQGMYRSKYWSCFDAIAQVRRKKVAVLSYHDIKWPKGLEFVYSPFSIIALQGDVKYAQVEFGEDGNPISIDMFEDGKICRRNDYDVVPDDKSGKAGEPVEIRFTKAEYDSLEAVIEEVFASYVNLTRQGDSFFVAMHPLHIRVAEHVLKGKRVIATFFENRFDFTQTSLAADFLEHAENIITDSDYTTKLIMANLGAVNNKQVRLHITDIPPYDTRMDFGISSQLRVQNILVPVDGLTKDAFAQIIKGLADYLTINDLARVHFFTRDASWGHEDAIKNDTVKLLDSMGYDSRWVTGDGEAALGFGGNGADAFAENELGDIEKPVEQRFFVDVCVDERDISKCINEQRAILDMRGTMDVFVYVTAISKGVPRISLSADQFLVSGKNGMVIDDFSDIGRSLTYYLDSFENWNQALVECYELGQKYTTSVLLKKWRKVLNFSE
jgi:accessory secretory protein Asp1